jgi:DUF2971 family protein
MTANLLRRYTDLPALVYMLNEQKITLLDPASWDDKNDSHYLTLYREKKRLGSVLALCFTQADETYHHWRVFANGSSGVCVTFQRPQLLQAMSKQQGIRSGEVTYLKLAQIRDRTLKTKELPFLKRYAFEHENEFRVIYESASDKVSALHISVPLSCIQRITLSPWIHTSLSSHIKKILHSIKGCGHLEIVRSTLISNEEWKTLGEDAT